MDLAACSLNSITLRQAQLPQLLDLAMRHGFGGVGLWRETYAEEGAAAVARRVRDAGLRVSSVCRGGMFPQRTAALRADRRYDNRRAIEEAHALGAECLVLVCGAPVDGDLAGARSAIEHGIRELIPDAAAAGVRLAIEPFHPMMITDRSAITSLTEANDLVERCGSPWLGLAVDSYHVWWDAALAEQMHRGADALMSLQLADWVLPIEGLLSSRGMPGEGHIDMPAFLRLGRECGYRDLVEIEVLSEKWWAADPAEAARAACEALRVLPDPAH